MYFNVIALVLSLALGTSAAPVTLTDPSVVTYGSVAPNATTEVDTTALTPADAFTGAKSFDVAGFRRSVKFGRDGAFDPSTEGPLIPVTEATNDTSSDNSTVPLGLQRLKDSSAHLAEFVGFRR
ncbi:hypothetical protein EVG20_g1451 [Dentipellis fragilis]|uniref:Uncharacterized protein n=1 Tax=Dentipellis fragilis TaxID=205917 RepID=A0A4Y9Z9N5_9AGAM|nr:hypothetical protein EVG20_g1451 [Dentipellis fragilis]